MIKIFYEKLGKFSLRSMGPLPANMMINALGVSMSGWVSEAASVCDEFCSDVCPDGRSDVSPDGGADVCLDGCVVASMPRVSSRIALF